MDPWIGSSLDSARKVQCLWITETQITAPHLWDILRFIPKFYRVRSGYTEDFAIKDIIRITGMKTNTAYTQKQKAFSMLHVT